jgi:hypothetical protein
MVDLPVGTMWGDERLLTMTDEQKQQYLADVMEHGPPVPGAVLTPPGVSTAPAAPTEVPADVFNPATDLYDANAYRSEPYTMPNGKRVWVHPVSLTETIQINRQVVKEIRAAGLMDPAKTETEAKVLAQDQGIELEFRGQVWQTICCARQGPSPDSPKVFIPANAEALRNNPGLAEPLREITEISSRLAQGKGEAQLLKEALCHFFGCMEPWLQTLHSQLETGSGDSCRLSLEDFANSVSVLKQQKKPWSVADLSALSFVMDMQTDAMTPEE